MTHLTDNIPRINIFSIGDHVPKSTLKVELFTQDQQYYGQLLGKTYVDQTAYLCLLQTTNRVELIRLADIHRIKIMGVETATNDSNQT